MIYILLNIRAIALATAGGLIVGALYKLVGGASTGASGFSVPLIVTAVLAEFWLASILAGALILAPPRAGPWVMAIGSAVVIWIGFVLPALLVTALSRGLSFGAGLADAGHWLAAMVVQAVVLHLVGLVRPPD
ncbi:hypothetical protein D3273_09840 [Lichenibacterium minor]|uniref:DUF1761 domain-containing protein n=1 Tax=Lichenibacterium minor TaxID=2316528 RepID=A0A4Q2U8V8_9HYPH|nr:hypothetical protein [Lichenibacterium minor]RYC32318.1 hypothetical protein D3273_09840 [Lichenibacterium minor]